MAMRKKQDNPLIEIAEMKIGHLKAHLLGTTPLIMHRADQKVLQELALPSEKKNRAGLASTLKHDLIGEYRGSIYINRDHHNAPTAIHFPSNAFSKTIADAALDIPGVAKAQIQRLASCATVNVAVYGIPRVFICMVRLSDAKRTPDIRSRALFTEWCCTISIKFSSTLLKEGQIANLLSAAGQICGIGDWRPQRGGSYGQWSLVNEDNADLRQLMKHCGKKAQIEAIKRPVCADEDSEMLLDWYEKECKRREIVIPSDVFTFFDDDSGQKLKVIKGGKNGRKAA